jgi:hypothetical protein
MRLRSTGLGKTELEAKIEEVKKVDDVVIFYVRTSKPVKWKVRMAFQQQDLRDLVKAILKPKNLCYILRALFSKEEKVPRSETF